MLELIVHIAMLVAGFVGLIKGADLFVDGSSSIARQFKVPGVIIGLTIVAMGTSAPELAVSTSAALSGSNEIALSNVLGSNIFNLLVVLGFCALFNTVPVEKNILKRDFPLLIVMSIAVFLLTCFGSITKGTLFSGAFSGEVGEVSRYIGIIFMVVFVIYIVVLIQDARKNKIEEEAEDPMPLLKSIGFILIGLLLIVAGGEGVVLGAKYIAAAAGMSETLIGLTIVAVGTSLPELVTSTVAAKKGEVGMAVGNAVGSSIFNLLLILGISSAIHPFGVNMASAADMLVQIFVVVVTLIFSATGKGITKLKGAIMLLMYVADIAFAIWRNYL